MTQHNPLTPEDIAWLEERIGWAVQPVLPREDFVRNARARVIAAAHEPPDPMEISLSKAFLATTFVFIAALIWRNYLSQRVRR